MNLWNSLLKTATCEIYVCSGPTVGKAAYLELSTVNSLQIILQLMLQNLNKDVIPWQYTCKIIFLETFGYLKGNRKSPNPLKRVASLQFAR